jgi:DNA gyrase subunit B
VAKGKAKPYYVQTSEEMRTQLLERGITDSELDLGEKPAEKPAEKTGEKPTDRPGTKRILRGEKMQKLATLLAGMEESLLALERRGISLKSHATRKSSEGKLPVFHVFLGRGEHYFTTRAQLDAFLEQQEAARGQELNVADTPTRSVSEGDPKLTRSASEGSALPSPTRSASEGVAPGSSSPTRSVSEGSGSEGSDSSPPDAPHAGNGRASSDLHITELHEVRTINQGLADLAAQFNIGLDMLIPQPRTGSDQPRFVLRRGEHTVPLEDLRGLAAAVREMGQKGLTVTRFKGLGEMNAEELRETTLDKANRTLIKVQMQDAGAADDMFRVLMGDKVEPRREFIEKHALEVRNLDV